MGTVIYEVLFWRQLFLKLIEDFQVKVSLF